MEWLQENWFWLFVFVMFIWMHMGGHGVASPMSRRAVLRRRLRRDARV